MAPMLASRPEGRTWTPSRFSRTVICCCRLRYTLGHRRLVWLTRTSCCSRRARSVPQTPALGVGPIFRWFRCGAEHDEQRRHPWSVGGQLMSRDLTELDPVVVMIDGTDFAGATVVASMIVTADGTKVPVGLRLGDTENATVVTEVLADLVDRGLDVTGGVLVVIDGAKALAAGVRRVFGSHAVIQRCVLHKRRIDRSSPEDRPVTRRLQARRDLRRSRPGFGTQTSETVGHRTRQNDVVPFLDRYRPTPGYGPTPAGRPALRKPRRARRRARWDRPVCGWRLWPDARPRPACRRPPAADRRRR